MEFIKKEWINNWEKYSCDERLKCLQEFENNCAYFEKRDARTIIIDSNSFTTPGEDEAHYSFETPNVIWLRHTSNDFFKCIENVFHEGFHAATDDYFNNKHDLLLLHNIDSNRLTEEYELRDILHNFCKKNNKKSLFDVAYYEEKLVRKQTYYFFLLLTISLCESENEFRDFLSTIFHEKIVGRWFSYKRFLGTLESEYSYDDIFYRKVLPDVEKFVDKKRKCTTNKIISIIEIANEIEKAGDEFYNNLWQHEARRINKNKYINNSIKLFTKYRDKLKSVFLSY